MEENIDLRMAEAIKLAKIAFFSYSFDGTILAIDRVAFDFFELEGIFKDPQSLIGKNIESLFEYMGPKGRIRDEIKAIGRISKLEYGIRTLKNTEKWGIHNSYIYIDEKTGEEAIQVCFYDITDRKLHEKETENQYKILVENSIEVIWTMDLEGNFTYMSPSVEMLRGYTVEEAMKMTLEETLTPESFIISMTELQNWLSKPNDEFPQSFTMELEQFKKDGTTVWTLVTIKPIFDNDGEVFELQGGTRDISQRKENEAALSKNEEKYRTIMNHVNDAFYAHDFKGKIIDVNVNSCNMLGYKKKELVGQNLSIFTS
ncbi:MAG: PAS domain S-box protein, partial [Spirochaetales bacterium]|nr:PAS domain S-box protein [Spirochaetales bacterium]